MTIVLIVLGVDSLFVPTPRVSLVVSYLKIPTSCFFHLIAPGIIKVLLRSLGVPVIILLGATRILIRLPWNIPAIGK